MIVHADGSPRSVFCSDIFFILKPIDMNAKRLYPKRGLRYVPLLLLLAGLAACTKQAALDTTLPPNYTGASTKATRDSMAKVLGELPFSNKSDLEFANYGFVKTLDDPQIKELQTTAQQKDTLVNVYNLNAFSFIKANAVDGKAPNTVNPSLWRQSYLNQLSGLYELQRGQIYQVRGFDLANMSIVKDGGEGWIVIDPLGSPGTAKAGIDLFNQYCRESSIGKTPITISAIIFTHSHLDHFGGVSGLKEYLIPDKLEVVAPVGFFDEAVSENVMAGNCMGRRATYMYGNLLQKDSLGTLGSGLGTQTSSGMASIMKENKEITTADNGKTTSVAGRNIVFWNAPGSEAPAEMIFWFPDFKAFCQAEDLNHTLHNLLTLRGAKVRNGLLWSKYIDKAIELWGDQVELSFGSHHWPTIKQVPDGKTYDIKGYWEEQRDLYRFIHDQTLRLANQGYTMDELAEMIHLPEGLNSKFHARGYYGSVNHDVKAQYQLYFGWFDGNPANLNPLPPKEAGDAYVRYIGRDAMFSAAKAAYLADDYRFAAELLNKLVFADDNDDDAKELLARCYDQLGYIAESGPWRNFYLTGAKELRAKGVIQLPAPAGTTPEIINNMPNELMLDYFAMKFKGTEKEAAALKYAFNVEITPAAGSGKSAAPDISGNKAVLIVSNGAVTARMTDNALVPATGYVGIKREDLNLLMLGRLSMGDFVEKANYQGNADCKAAFSKFTSFIDNFNFWFNIVRD